MNEIPIHQYVRFFFRTQKKRPRKTGSARYRKYKEQARSLVHAKLAFWSVHYPYSYGRVAIRDQKTRWGSCSKKGNLNFNYKIVFLPDHLVDYIIVHELCHRAQFNHSPAFWDLVALHIPAYTSHIDELRIEGPRYVAARK